MITKRKTVKKKTTKKREFFVAATAPVSPFDLKKPSATEQLRQIGALKSLQVSEGWILLRMTLMAQVESLDAQIIAKRTHDGGALTDADCDVLRSQRGVIQGLVDKPELLLGELERVEEDVPDDDPYEGSRPVRSRRD